MLLHDIGKPFSYQDKEIRHFKGHPIVSKEISSKILNRLGYKCEFISYILDLIEHHDTPIKKDLIKTNVEFYKDLYIIQYCDSLAHHPDKLKKRKEYLIKMLVEFKNINIDVLENKYIKKLNR